MSEQKINVTLTAGPDEGAWIERVAAVTIDLAAAQPGRWAATMEPFIEISEVPADGVVRRFCISVTSPDGSLAVDTRDDPTAEDLADAIAGLLLPTCECVVQAFAMRR
jgi:hypothetical protein